LGGNGFCCGGCSGFLPWNIVHQTMKISKNMATPASTINIHISALSMLFARVSLLVSIIFGMVACTTVQPPPVVTPPATVPPVTKSAETLQRSTFEAMPGWGNDDLREAWPAFLNSCNVLGRKQGWQEACIVARQADANNADAIRAYFETWFVPYQVFNSDGSSQGLITGYYEPLLHGARKRGGIYQTPLYKAPDDLLTIDLTSVYPELKGMRLRGRVVGNKVVPYYSRAELAQSDSLANKVLCWVDDPIAAFFLQVQGSGRVVMEDTKEIVRVAYADQNGYPYRSIGKYLVANGELTLDQASAQGIKNWIATHPERQQELLNANPSYVFFKEERIADPAVGPKGALGVPLTPQRSIAIDAQLLPLGVPVFLATTLPNSDVPLQRLVMAQDTGGAIRGAVRADYFWGFGDVAGENAGRMKQQGVLWVLLPKLQTASTAAR
jgi:membrane-bound lytic murein transglycosylase A